MVVALSKLVSYWDRLLLSFFLKVLPELLKLLILFTCIVWKRYILIKATYEYTRKINSNTVGFRHHLSDHTAAGDECSICLSEFAEGDICRQLVHCNHSFHAHCLETWLKGYTAATCPLCRTAVLPAATVDDYRNTRRDGEDDYFEKEVALILLNALRTATCNAARCC